MSKSDALTTKELAEYLKLNEKTVLKMAQSGEVPGIKMGNQRRFFLSTIDEYLQDKIIKSSGYDFGIAIKTPDIIPLSGLVDHTTINLELKPSHNGAILHELAEIAQEAEVSISIEHLLIQLQKREDMLSTAVGNGVAIPHPRNPSDDLFKKPSIVIARSIKAVNLSSPDKKKVHLFYDMCP